MDKIEQFIYTSSPWGKSGSGWMVFQQSPGLTEGTHKTVYPFLNYRVPRGFNSDTSDETELASFPVQFVCAKAPDGRGRFILQTCYSGNRWWEGRSGDFWAQTYIVSESAWASLPSKTNPIQWFRSPSIGTRYPDEMRELAKAIINREREYEAPPDLPTLDSLDELEPNHGLDFESVLGRIPGGAWPKLGVLLAALIKRGSDAKAFVFNATRPESLDTMAALLALMPSCMRMEAQFSTFFHAENVRETKADDTFLFYGTVRDGESADSDTGLYGELPEGGPEFRCREDVELFKRMVDAGGLELKKEEFDDLVLCWEIAAGRRTDAMSLRKAVQFAERFPGMKDEISNGLKNVQTIGQVGPELLIVACFELGMPELGGEVKQDCEECVRNPERLAEALRILETEASRANFLTAVYETCKTRDDRAEFVRTWLSLEHDVRNLAPSGVFAWRVATRQADKFETIRNDIQMDRVSEREANRTLADLKNLESLCGDSLDGFSEAKRKLEYLSMLSTVHSVDELSSFLERANGAGVNEERIFRDTFRCLAPESFTPAEQLSMIDMFSANGLPREEVLKRLLKAAEDMGRQRGEREGKEAGRRQIETLQNKFDEKPRCASRLAVVVVVLVCLLFGVAAGAAGAYFLVSRESMSGAEPETPTLSAGAAATRIHVDRDESGPTPQAPGPVDGTSGDGFGTNWEFDGVPMGLQDSGSKDQMVPESTGAEKRRGESVSLPSAVSKPVSSTSSESKDWSNHASLP